MHRGPAHLGLHVVPGRPLAILRGELHHLRVARVLPVVTPAVAKVDAADERHILARRARVPQHDQLLVMAAAPPGPGVQQDLAAVRVDLPDELRVGLLGLAQRLRVGPPQQAEHPDPPPGRPAQHLAGRGTRAIQELVEVTPEVQEIDLVAVLGGVDLGVQPGEVAAPVHQRLDQVAGGEGAEVGGPVGTVALGQEPRLDGRVIHGVVGGVLLEGVISRIGRAWEHAGIVPLWSAGQVSKVKKRADCARFGGTCSDGCPPGP